MLFRGIVLGLIAITASVGCGDCNPTEFHLDAPSADASTFGQVSLAWTVTDLDGRTISCDQIAARTVSLLLRNRAGAGGAPESLSCGNSPSTTRAFESGTYNVTIQLNGDDGTLATATDQSGVVITGGQITPLAPVVFRIDPTGSLALSIKAPPAASNCQSAPAGAGITSMAITLLSAGGSCAAVTFLRSRGSTPLGSYTVNCGSPLFGSCIENDETLTPEVPLTSGPYKIQVRGRIGPTECFANNDDLRVPAVGKVLTRTLNLANTCAPAVD
jgi:hypothetical protein